MAPEDFIIKICGLNDAASVDAASDAGADWLGFVFVPSSPRYLEPHEASGLMARVPKTKKRVGLFAQTSASDIADITKIAALDMIQLHGTESVSDILAVQAATSLPLITARGIRTRKDLKDAQQMPGDYLLLDARAPEGSTRQGGLGQPFDWSLLDGFDSKTNWLLAGGLTPENVGQAIGRAKPIQGFVGVDVSSGVEITPGRKDPASIYAFVAAARAAMAP